MTNAAQTDPTDRAAQRRASRQHRQARVGILRNPNDPPRPPPRRAALMGRWLNLRSGRRPSAQHVEGALQSLQGLHAGDDPAAGDAPLVRHSDDGQVGGIDIVGLMASVDGVGETQPIRAPYAGPKQTGAPRPRAPAKAAILTASAWLDPVEDPVQPVATPLLHDAPPARQRHPARKAALIVLVMALLLVVLVPAVLGG